METNQLHRGRLIDHLHLVVRDLEKSYAFYEAAFGALKIPLGQKGNDFFWFDELYISNAQSKSAHGELTGRVHLAFQAPDQKSVDEFYQAAMKAGGRDNGKPGERPYHPGYYACFVLDPDGNNIEAVFHGPSKRSAKSVVVDF